MEPIDSNNQRLQWQARLKRDINLTSRKFLAGDVVTLMRGPNGTVHIQHFKSATVADKDWELAWNEKAVAELLDRKD
jgi:hypothetical protein